MAQQVKNGRFVGADHQAAGGVIAQFGQRIVEPLLQALKAARVVERDAASVGEDEPTVPSSKRR